MHLDLKSENFLFVPSPRGQWKIENNSPILNTSKWISKLGKKQKQTEIQETNYTLKLIDFGMSMTTKGRTLVRENTNEEYTCKSDLCGTVYFLYAFKNIKF